jgi:hypothetical protein
LNEIQATNQPVFQRSFVFFDDKKRTHAINGGFPEGVNYSYDTKKGALLHVSVVSTQIFFLKKARSFLGVLFLCSKKCHLKPLS